MGVCLVFFSVESRGACESGLLLASENPILTSTEVVIAVGVIELDVLLRRGQM